jgi:hypothetical protein
MEKIKMSSAQFLEFINNIKGCQFVSILALTEPDMYTRNNPFKGRVKKLVKAPMQINYDYEKAVNNRLEKEGKEGNFSADKLPWGSWVKGMENKIILHNDNYYLRTYCIPGKKIQRIFLIDGRLATANEKEELENWLKPAEKSEKQKNAGLSAEKEVKPRTYQFGNLLSVKINHTRIVIED